MKFLFSIAILFSTVAFASEFETDSSITKEVQGYNNAYGYCDGNNSYFCIMNIKDQGKRYAENEARTRCEMYERGRYQTWSTSCSDYCTPSYIAPNEKNVYVSCRLDCRGTCEIESN